MLHQHLQLHNQHRLSVLLVQRLHATHILGVAQPIRKVVYIHIHLQLLQVAILFTL